MVWTNYHVLEWTVFGMFLQSRGRPLFLQSLDLSRLIQRMIHYFSKTVVAIKTNLPLPCDGE